MNHEARLRRLEAQTKKATINTWVDLVSYSGPFPVMVSDEMAPLFTGAIHEPGRKTQGSLLKDEQIESIEERIKSLEEKIT